MLFSWYPPENEINWFKHDLFENGMMHIDKDVAGLLKKKRHNAFIHQINSLCLISQLWLSPSSHMVLL